MKMNNQQKKIFTIDNHQHKQLNIDSSVLTPEQVGKELFLEIAANCLPEFIYDKKPIALSGGLLNYVWRLNGKEGSSPQSLIVKWAPPYIASSPEVPLDPDRIIFEAKAMSAFDSGGSLSNFMLDGVRLPVLFNFDPVNRILLMEDVCDCSDLSAWIEEEHTISETKQIGNKLGKFIGQLHSVTFENEEIAKQFNNKKIQKTRLEVLYKNVHNYAVKAGLKNSEDIGKIASEYGELLQKPGFVLIMGDLWLPSIFVMKQELRIIDWEMTHYGRPSQDIGHFTAHLWMYSHNAKSEIARSNARQILEEFLISYRSQLGARFSDVFGIEGVRESAIHLGSEILARTVGIFQNGFLYEGLDPFDPITQKATEFASAHILEPLKSHTFDALNWRQI